MNSYQPSSSFMALEIKRRSSVIVVQAAGLVCLNEQAALGAQEAMSTTIVSLVFDKCRLLMEYSLIHLENSLRAGMK